MINYGQRVIDFPLKSFLLKSSALMMPLPFLICHCTPRTRNDVTVTLLVLCVADTPGLSLSVIKLSSPLGHEETHTSQLTWFPRHALLRSHWAQEHSPLSAEPGSRLFRLAPPPPSTGLSRRSKHPRVYLICSLLLQVCALHLRCAQLTVGREPPVHSSPRFLGVSKPHLHADYVLVFHEAASGLA